MGIGARTRSEGVEAWRATSAHARIIPSPCGEVPGLRKCMVVRRASATRIGTRGRWFDMQRALRRGGAVGDAPGSAHAAMPRATITRRHEVIKALRPGKLRAYHRLPYHWRAAGASGEAT